MFPYFGRKARTAHKFPAPRFPLVIEPFAGSLSYSLHYRPEQAIGIERDERVVAMWHRLLTASGLDPAPPVGSKTDDLLVKVCSYSEHALTSGTLTVTTRMVRDWAGVHRNAAAVAPWAAVHTRYQQGTYADAPDVEATWFIDPPYQKANRRGYKYGGSSVDFKHLAEWVRSRRGQVIVCEQQGADWMPFRPLASIATHRGSVSQEVIWLNSHGPLPERPAPDAGIRDLFHLEP